VEANHFILKQDHPFFLGLQAHPEFCSRPLNPSPPFLGLVAAACGQSVLVEQLKVQEETFVPPHPSHAMLSEAQIRNNGEPIPDEIPTPAKKGDATAAVEV
jgi:CTP synthase